MFVDRDKCSFSRQILFFSPSNLLEFTKRLIELTDYDLETLYVRTKMIFIEFFFRFRE